MKSLWIVANGGVNEPSVSKISSTTAGQEQSKIVQPSKADPNSKGQAQRGPAGFGMMQILLLVFLFVFMYFILFRGPKKREQEHRKMIQSLKKNDKVRTIGGIIGVIVDVKDDEITLKVDESNNTKIKVIPSAVGKNLSDEKSS
jgi:preprotein translocase subunit YajC